MPAFLAAIFLAACSKDEEKNETFDNSRLVSFSPSTTEALFALGLGKNVVGVSKFCNYPPEAASLPKVGGFIDPNIEAVVRMRPTCAVLQRNGADIGKSLQGMGIPVLFINGNTLQDVLDSFMVMGNALDKKKEAAALAASFRRQMDALKENAPATPPSILLVIWRDAGTGGIRNLQAAGNDGFYSELVKTAGGRLLPENTKFAYPSISSEGVMQLNPDYIIELLPDIAAKGQPGIDMALEDWSKDLPDLPAVKNSKVFVIPDDFAVIPGPRSILLAQKIQGIIRPSR